MVRSSRSRLGQHLAANNVPTSKVGAVGEFGRPSQTRTNQMYQVGKDVRLLFLTGQINQTDSLTDRTSPVTHRFARA
jgi:hypothetical protein